MKTKIVSLFLLFAGIMTFAAFQLVNTGDDAQTSSALVKTDHFDQKPEKNLAWAYRNMMNNKPSNLRIILIQEAPGNKCKEEGTCAEYRLVKDNGKESQARIKYRVTQDRDWAPEKLETGIVFIGGTAFAGQYNRETNTMTLIKGDVSKILGTIQGFKLKPGKQKPTSQMQQNLSVVAVIPPFIWDWWTETDGQCCEDCWATHRSVGLPCSADYACCFGTCGIQPGCGDSPGGGPGLPGDDDDENECGDEYYTPNATVDTGDSICDYAGTVQPTPDGMGGCVDVATGGVLSNCQSKVGGGGGPTEPEEVKSFF